MSRFYHYWAERLANGTQNSNEVYGFAPLPAYVFAAIYKLFDALSYNIRILNILLGTLTCLVVFLLGKELMGRGGGLLAALLAAIYQPFIFYSVVPMKTMMGVFLFGLSVYFLLSFLRREGVLKCCLAGASLGLLLATRENAIALFPVALGLVIWRGLWPNKIRGQTLSWVSLFILSCAFAASPFLVHNFKVSGELSMTAGQAGSNVYVGNNTLLPDPYYRPLPFASSSPTLQATQFTIEASRRSNKKLMDSDASSFWIAQTFRESIENPSAFALKLARKVLVLFNRFEAGDHYDIPFTSQFVSFFQIPLPGFTIVMALGVASLLTLLRSDVNVRVVGLLAFFYAATLVIIYTNARYRLPLMTIVIPLAAMGIHRCWYLLQNGVVSKHSRSKRLNLPLTALTLQWSKIKVESRSAGQVLIYLGLVGGFALLAHLPVYGTDDSTAYYNTHAIILDSEGRLEEAMEYWEQSSEMNRPFSAFANLSLARIYLSREDWDTGQSYLDRIPDSSFAADDKYSAIGDALLTQERAERAAEAFRRSISINAGAVSPRRKLIQILRELDSDAAARAEKELELVYSFYPASVYD